MWNLIKVKTTKKRTKTSNNPSYSTKVREFRRKGVDWREWRLQKLECILGKQKFLKLRNPGKKVKNKENVLKENVLKENVLTENELKTTK